MKKHIIIVNGTGGSGKDSFVHFCSRAIDAINISTVDKVKVAGKILGWPGTKTEKDRAFLSDLKLLASEYYDHPYEYIKGNIGEFVDIRNAEILFVHSREPQEIQRFKEDFNCITVLVTNPRVPLIMSNMADANVLNYPYDYEIQNNGTLDDLEKKAFMFVNDLKRKDGLI